MRDGNLAGKIQSIIPAGFQRPSVDSQGSFFSPRSGMVRPSKKSKLPELESDSRLRFVFLAVPIQVVSDSQETLQRILPRAISCSTGKGIFGNCNRTGLGVSNEQAHLDAYPNLLRHVGHGCRQFGHETWQRAARAKTNATKNCGA